MTLSTEVKKLAESKPFYAVAGAGDFAVEKLRGLPERINRLQSRRGEIRDAAKDLPEKARELAGRAEGYARDFPVKARGYADHFTVRATELYEQFATRGRKVVSRASGGAALELKEVSKAAAPASATRKNSRAPKSGSPTRS